MTLTQKEFTAALLNSDLPVPVGLIDGEGRPAGKRFSVYRNNVAVGLTEALKTAFPVITKLVGDVFFEAMAGVFLRAHPPTSPLIMFYGAAMPDFLSGFEPVAHLGYLPDVARLELAMRHAYHAADQAPVPPGALQDLSPDRLMGARLGFAPAMQLIRSAWPLHGIWRANMIPGAPPAPPHAENTLITRAEFDPTPTLLPLGGATFIAALQSGNTIAAAYSTTTQTTKTFDLAATIGILLAGGAITQIIEDTYDA